jgi:hypothetical protein
MFRWLEDWFGKSNFYPFEMMILERVISQIEGENGLRLQQQIEVINHIQRHRGGREVNLYQMRNGKVIFDDHLRFRNPPDEELLACVILRSPAQRAELNAEVWMAGGRIFSLEFNKEPKQFFSGIHLRNAQPEIAEVIIRGSCNNL